MKTDLTTRAGGSMVELVTTYEVLKSVHVLAAVIWVGGAATLQAMAFAVLRARDPAEMASFSRNAGLVGQRLFTPASLVLLVFGAWTVHEGGFSYHQTWLWVALVVFAASFVVGAGFIGPEAGRLAKAIERQGPDSAEARMRLDRILLVSRIELVFLLLIVVDMVVKPGI
jgi:uncharacterized membrane protein